MLIFINPGHSPNGKPDPGVVSPTSGRLESAVAYNIGSTLKKFLDDAGHTSILYQAPELWQISAEANRVDADLFISIHCNGSAAHTARGTETFHYYGSETSALYAHAIHNQLVASIPDLWNRGVKTADFHVLRATAMPAVLVETAFLDNQDDERLLVRFSNEFAAAIARGVTDCD